MRIIPIIDQLKANVPLLENRVAPALSLHALAADEIDTGLPLCYVHPLVEKATPNEEIGSITQALTQRFTLLYAVENVDVDEGAEALEDLRDQVFAALLNFRPEGYGPIEFVEGEILDISRRYIWWSDAFKLEGSLCSS
jgi:hypothetical protein